MALCQVSSKPTEAVIEPFLQGSLPLWASVSLFPCEVSKNWCLPSPFRIFGICFFNFMLSTSALLYSFVCAYLLHLIASATFDLLFFFNSRYREIKKFSVMVSLTHKNIEKQAPLPNPNAHKWQINTKEAKAKASSHSTWCFKELVPAFFFPHVWHWLKLLRHSLQFCELGIIDQIFLLHFCEICVNNPLLFPLDTVL